MTAGEYHAQQLVLDEALVQVFVQRRGDGLLAQQMPPQFRCKLPGGPLATQYIERPILCRRHQPRRGVVRYATELPDFQCAANGVLDHVLDQVEVVYAEDAGEHGDKTRRLVPEEVVSSAHLSRVRPYRTHLHGTAAFQYRATFSQFGGVGQILGLDDAEAAYEVL